MTERFLIWVLLGTLIAGCLAVLQPFIAAIAWAAILTFTTWPIYCWLRTQLRMPKAAAALLMVVMTALLILLPLTLIAENGLQNAANLRRMINEVLIFGLPAAPPWVATLPVFGSTVSDVWNHWSADLESLLAAIHPYLGIVAKEGLQLLIAITDGVVRMGLALFIAFFLFMYGEPLARNIRGFLSRIIGGQAERLLTIVGATVRGAVYGILGTALVQGIMLSLGLWISGVPNAAALALAGTFFSLVPGGGALIWVPAAIWLLSSGDDVAGLGLAAWCGIGISMADSFVRPWFIARGAHLPFILTLLGVLGGALAFGILGVFLGPVLLGVGFILAEEFARGAPLAAAAEIHAVRLEESRKAAETIAALRRSREG
ncbi:MAG: AI-2E family transporter [Proteobacteria bacterium]|nr:AI-2E family transporter [Pseudomonadota bacterium]